MLPEGQAGGESAREGLIAHPDGKDGAVAIGHLGAQPGGWVCGFGLEACVLDSLEDLTDG